MFQEAAQQQAAHLFHGVFGRERDRRGQVALPTAPLDLAQEVLRQKQREVTSEPPRCLIGRPKLCATSNAPAVSHASTASLTQ